MKKMNNKGFSLVELIIVIAIMAILAGALAPALLRYIEKTRVSNDKSTAANLKTAVEAALADEDVFEAVEGAATDNFLTFNITTNSSGATYLAPCPSVLQEEIEQTLATSKLKIKSKKDLAKQFTVAIALGSTGEADVVEVFLKRNSDNKFVDTQGVDAGTTVDRTDLITSGGGNGGNGGNGTT